MNQKKKKGFTLTELLITLAIIAVLLAIAIPVISGLLNKGTDTSEDVNAALYTSIMNKFAVEEVQTAGCTIYVSDLVKAAVKAATI